MTPRIVGRALFALLLAVACVPPTLPGDSSSVSMPPPPPPPAPLSAQASASAYTPTPQSAATPATVQPAGAPAVPPDDCVVIGAPPSTTGAAAEREVLIAFYQATNGPNWLRSDNWLTDAPLDAWHGVTTNKDGLVIEVDLSENGLSGEIPPELGYLRHLTRLDLAGNRLSGEVPAGLRDAVSWCTDTQTVMISFPLEESGKTVSICQDAESDNLIYSFGVPGGEPELEYRGPLLGDFTLTASLWGEGIGNLAELASYADNDEVAKAVESLDTNGFYRVGGLTGMFSQGVYIFRHGGWEFAILSEWGRSFNYGYQTSGHVNNYESHEITVTSPTGETYRLQGPSVGACLKGP